MRVLQSLLPLLGHFPTSDSAKHEGRALPPSSQPVLGCRMSQNPQKVARHSPKPCPSDTPGGILGGSTPYPPPGKPGYRKETPCAVLGSAATAERPPRLAAASMSTRSRPTSPQTRGAAATAHNPTPATV